MGARIHPEIDAVPAGTGLVHVGLIQGHALLQIGTSREEVTEMRVSRAEPIQGREEAHRVLDALGQREELLPQLSRSLEFGPYEGKLQ